MKGRQRYYCSHQVSLLSDGTAGETAVQEFQTQPHAEQLRSAVAIAQSAMVGPLFLPTAQLDPAKVTVIKAFKTLQELNMVALHTLPTHDLAAHQPSSSTPASL